MLESTYDQFSGLNFTWNPDEEVGWRVVDAWVEESAGSWKLLDSSTVYTVSCMDYIANGGDGHTVYPLFATDVINTGVSSDTVMNILFCQHITWSRALYSHFWKCTTGPSC